MKTPLMATLAALACGAASGVQPEVMTVPWVAGNPLVPHNTYDGKSIHLKGTCNVQGPNFQYTWDFGDGPGSSVSGTVTNRHAVEATHAYTGLPGTVFIARLTVTDTSTSESASRNYYVQIEPKTLDAEVNVAIDEALWYLFKAATRSGDMNYWTNSGGGGGYDGFTANPTASAVQAFQIHGHHEGQAGNPYAEAVSGGFDYLFTRLYVQSMSLQAGENPDSNANGIGLSTTGNHPIYETGAVIDALVASGTPDMTARTGPANVIGRRYQEIVQDLVDMYAWGQVDSGWALGGWRYSWNYESDNSAAQWGAIGMSAAERTTAHPGPGGDKWAVVPRWVKDRNLVWLNYSYHPAGYFGYTGSGPNRAFSTGPCGMVQLAFDGETVANAKWASCETYLRNNWNSFISIGNDTRYYSYYALTKAMRLALPTPVTLLGGTIDWYGDNTRGLARVLVDRQNSGGSWAQDGWPFVGPQTAAAWNLIILSPTLFEAGFPVAIAKALPNPAVVGQTIMLDASDSYHTDPGKEIVRWEWDLDHDGTFDATGPFASVSFPILGTYMVGLRVTDDGEGAAAQSAEATLEVFVTIPPLAPTADAGGPYVLCPGATRWFLDATGSNNPDEGQSESGMPGDTIQEYAWDLDGDGSFDDAFGPTPDVTAFFQAEGPGDYLVRVRVTDTTSTSFPSSPLGDQSDTDSGQVHVAVPGECDCIDDLAARAKTGEVQLTWTDRGDHHYNVYRSTTSGGPYLLIASTDSRYSTYLDMTAVNDVTYYYVVRPANILEQETCQSNEASATPVPLNRRR